MYNVEDIIKTALTLAGRGDKPSNDMLNEALRALQLILGEWATVKDVTFWNIADTRLDLLQGDVVKVGDNYYQCYVNHTALAVNQPEVGAVWENFWVSCAEVTTPLTWALGNAYLSQRELTLTDFNLEDILCLKIFDKGQESSIEKISMIEFQKLPLIDIGTPTKCWAQKTLDGLILHFYPLIDNAETTLSYYSINRPNPISAASATNLPEQWIQALQYTLATELGFLYNISLDRLNILGQKAKFEMDKAMRTNNSEVDTCFVKPLY